MNELATWTNEPVTPDFVGSLTDENVSFCSFDAQTEDDKLKLYDIMNAPDKRIGDCINEVINVKDIFCEVVPCHREDGSVSYNPRIVLIDTDGVSYQSVSMGIYTSVKNLIRAIGMPTWEKGVKLKVVQVTRGVNKMLTLKRA